MFILSQAGPASQPVLRHSYLQDEPSVHRAHHGRAGGIPRAEPRERLSADLAGWDFVSPGPASTGARLWQRVRTRLDLLARTQGMSRCELLVYVLLTLAAHPSSRLLVLDCCDAPYS